MHRIRAHKWASIIAVAAMLSIVRLALPQAEAPVAVIPIAPLNGGDLSEAHAINDAGVVAGSQFVGWPQHAFIWDLGHAIDLGSLDGRHTQPADINERNQVVGYSNVGGLFQRAFLWTDNQMIDLGTLGGDQSSAEGISDSGAVVGWAHVEVGSSKVLGFIWRGIGLEPLTTLGGSNSFGRDITSQGTMIVGSARLPDESFHATLWTDPQTVVDLGTLREDRYSQAYAINDAGDIVGYSGNNGDENHAFLWRDGMLIDIHRPSLGESSTAHSINNRGEVCGVTRFGALNGRAAYWTPQLNMVDLNDLVPPKSGWTLQVAWDINDHGQMACQAWRDERLNSVGALVTPVYPTMSLAAPSPGTAGASNTLTVTEVTPGARVAFLYSKRGGGTIIPGCDLQQNALQLDRPAIIGSAVADGSGIATITRTVPLIARGQTILFQAVVQGECAISQLVVHQFE